MGEDRWEKLAAATGIVFVVIVIVGSFIAGQPPKADDPINKITAFAIDKRFALLLGDYLSAVGVVFALWFFGSLRSYLHRPTVHPSPGGLPERDPGGSGVAPARARNRGPAGPP